MLDLRFSIFLNNFKFILIKIVVCLAVLVLAGLAFANDIAICKLNPVHSIPFKCNRFKILVWPYETDVLKDIDLYMALGLGGFEIDRGVGQENKVKLSIQKRFPYYAGHVAGKGILYLIGNDARKVVGKRWPVVRPYTLASPINVNVLKSRIKRNLSIVKNENCIGYAFDDEISLGRLITPCDVDIHPMSIAWFHKWLRYRYGQIKRLNNEWGSSYKSFKEISPTGFERIRKKYYGTLVTQWNLSPWMDFRSFMDFQFAKVLSCLTRFTNGLDPLTPAGFVGGQAPSPWGGYDYALLSRAVQWMEAYDIHGTNEILRSFWNQDKRLRMQTFFSTGNLKLDSWFLWYYLLHGNQGVIAWPERWFHVNGQSIVQYIRQLTTVFREVQGKTGEVLVNGETKFDPDPIGIYYSQPSINVSWIMDALVHGDTWINRKSSIDNCNQSKGILRTVWCKTLEDLGYQYDFISYLDVQEGKIDLNAKYKVIILPKTICLSDKEAECFARFVKRGGVLIADYLCGVMDEHGKGRKEGVLDELFGIRRDESKGYLNGQGLTEIDGEKYTKPFLKRFTYCKGATRYKGIVVFERGTTCDKGTSGIKVQVGLLEKASVIMRRKVGKGEAAYLNLTPLEYWAPEKRFSAYGHQWRKIVKNILSDAGLCLRVRIYENGNTINMIEALWWKNGDRHFLGIVKNPTLEKKLKKLGDITRVVGITGSEENIDLEFNKNVALIDMRTCRHLGVNRVFRVRFKPWEGNLYEVRGL